jgi:peptidoglycan/xylan/chitin deacetylase (PgdA/CDA1 family)
VTRGRSGGGDAARTGRVDGGEADGGADAAGREDDGDGAPADEAEASGRAGASARGEPRDAAGSRRLDWPATGRAYLTLDLECDYGTAGDATRFDAADAAHVERLVDLLERHDAPLTCFVQTRVLEERPESVELLRDADVPVTFHPHSHTHLPRGETTTASELEASTAAFREYFGRDPVGYRFPDGNVRPEDYAILEEHGYEFDASVFPTFRPGRFNNLDADTVPTYLPAYDLYEVPFTVFREWARVPTALSYCTLLGAPYTELLVRRPPPVAMINLHMHDLSRPPAYHDLPPLYRAVYARTSGAEDRLDRLVGGLRDAGHEFETVDAIHDALRGRT